MTEYCQKVYFATEPYTVATFIIVNICLFYLLRGLREQDRATVQIPSANQAHCLSLLPKNVDIAVRKFDLMTTQDLNNIKAIVLAVGP